MKVEGVLTNTLQTQHHAKNTAKMRTGAGANNRWSKLTLHNYAQKWFTAAPHA
jgi:hypothetical protein